MFPYRSLILAILRVATFSIEVPERERERELSKEQYAIKAAAEVAYCFEPNSLRHKSAENGYQRIARIKTTGGGFHLSLIHI